MNMNRRFNATRIGRPLALAMAVGASTLMTSALPAFAQTQPAPPDATAPQSSEPLTTPLPEVWNSAWDADGYDRLHYVIGTVASFSPYRLLVARGTGVTTAVDLKKGTVIRPIGLTLSPGERVAVIGYWSKGTFIADRIVLRQG